MKTRIDSQLSELGVGQFEEEVNRLWLRWCDRDGQVIPTGAEGQNKAQQRAERLAERLRAMGIDPDTELSSTP